MSGESAQDIEVSITAPNRSFHATVIASDVSWNDRTSGMTLDQSPQLPRRPVWASAFGESTDIESESLDPMINSGTSLSQDSLDGFAVEFISSKENIYMNGDVSTGFSSSGDAAVEAAAAAAAAAHPDAAAAAAAFTAPAAASDAVSSSIEMRPVGFAETDRGSISCEMITPKPVVVGNGHVPSGEITVSSSINTTVTETTVTSASNQPTVTTSTTDTTVTSSSNNATVTSSSSTTVTSADDSAVTTHEPMAPGTTFQMSRMDSLDENAEEPERPRDRAMSLHERSMLAHDIHSLASTMDTIKDEDEENNVGSSTTTEEKRPEESYDSDRRASLTGVPISATTYIAPSQPTIFEAAESAAAAIAAAAEAAAPAAAATDAAAPAAADEPSPYLRKLLDAQEATRQLMALLGESTQMLGTLPTTKPEAEKEQQSAADAAAPAATDASPAAAAGETTASGTSFTSQSSYSMSSSSAFSSSTTAADATAATTEQAAAEVAKSSTQATDATAASAAPIEAAAPATPTSPKPAAPAADAAPSAAADDAAVPQSPALEILSRPIDITFDDGSVVAPSSAAPAVAAAAASTEIPVTVWQQPDQEPAASATAPDAAPTAETQNASICNALESIAANMTTVTTTSTESSSTLTTTDAPLSLGAPVLQLLPAASPTVSISEDAAPAADAAPLSTAASFLHDATVVGLTVDLPTPRLTPEPGQERFVTNNEQSEATITKSSFSLESSTSFSSSTESGSAAAAASTDYVLPATSVVLNAEPESAAAAAAPAGETPAPTLTPATVDVPVEIVRHLDDASAWHSPSGPAADADGDTAVRIAVVPEGGPPPLAREPPLPEAEPQGPPPLARESEEHHEFNRSVMVERRVLSPDSAAHAAAAAAEPAAPQQDDKPVEQATIPAASAASDQPSDVAAAVQQESKPAKQEVIPAAVAPPVQQSDAAAATPQDTKPAEQAASPAADAPAAQQSDAAAAPAADAAKPSDAPIDIPVTVVQQDEKPAEPAQVAESKIEPTPGDSTSVPIPVSIQQESTADSTAEKKASESVSIPVSIHQDMTAESGAESKPAEPTPASDSGSVPIPVSIQQDSGAEAKPSESATAINESTAVPASVQPDSTTVSGADPVTIVQEEPSKTTESTEIPVTMWKQADQEAAAPAATDIPVSVVQQESQGEKDQPAAADAAAEVPVASAAAQEQKQEQQAAPAADEATTSPTTAHAPISLESTFQIMPSEEDSAHPPTMLRDRAMSIHERSLLAHEPSGFQPALEALPENEAGEVHVANAAEGDMARRASLAPGAEGVVASTAFQAASTSCLFTVDEAAPRDEEDESAAPASTASPSNESVTTIASSIIDVTAYDANPAAKTQEKPSEGVKWLNESETRTPESPQTVVAAAPVEEKQAAEAPSLAPKADEAEQNKETSSIAAVPTAQTAPVHAADAQPSTPKSSSALTEPSKEGAVVTTVAPDAAAAPAADVPPSTPKSPSAPSIKDTASTPAAPVTDASQTAAAAPAADASPPIPKSPSGTSCVTEPASQDSAAASAAAVADAAQTSVAAPAADAPPQTPKSPSGVSWVTQPSSQDNTAAPAAPTIDAPQPAVPAAEAPPTTPKTPSGVSWITEPSKDAAAAAAEASVQQQQSEAAAPAASTDQPPATPKSPSGGVSWITEPASAQPETQPAPQTPKSPTGVTWITDPVADTAVPVAPMATAADAAKASTEAPPQTTKTPTGVNWITEPAEAAAPPPPSSPSVINITAPIDQGGAPRSPKSPTSLGTMWASESTRTSGNASDAGGAPAPAESTFVVNAPWEGADRAPEAREKSPTKPDEDGVTWITEVPAAPPVSKEPGSASRPPLSRSESTRSERDPSTATDITVREATPQTRTLAPSSVSGDEDLANGVMQESLGTKVRKLSWADQQPSVAEDSFSAAIDDYERKLNETTAQTKELVDLLCQTGDQITVNSMKMSDVFNDAVQAGVRSMLDQERRDKAEATALSPITENGEPISREPPPQLVAGALPPNVESVIVSCEELKYVTGSLVLESANILVTDDEAGLFLFTLDSKVVRHVTNPAWKHASSPCIFKDRLKSYILILMDCKDEEDGSWVRHIVKFSENLDYLEKVECPKWIRERTIISDRLAVNRYENIYYCANGEIFSGLYELAPTGKWTELLYRQSESFVDMLAFAIIGPIQQILVVEGRRDHVLLCSIRESVCVEARRMAICERPGALARDESGRLFVMNRAQAAVQIVDTRVWAACRNMALVDKFVPHFSASFGMLVIPQKRAVKVHKYSFEWDD